MMWNSLFIHLKPDSDWLIISGYAIHAVLANENTQNLRGIWEALHAYPTIDLSLFLCWLSLISVQLFSCTFWESLVFSLEVGSPGIPIKYILSKLNKILIWLASAPISLLYDLCMLFLRCLNIATKSKLAWLKRIFLFPNALFRIQYSSAENTIPGVLHFALFRIDISTTNVV